MAMAIPPPGTPTADTKWNASRPDDPRFPDEAKCGHRTTPADIDDYYLVNYHASQRPKVKHIPDNTWCNCPDCLPMTSTDQELQRCWNIKKHKRVNGAERKKTHNLEIEAINKVSGEQACPDCRTPTITFGEAEYPLCYAAAAAVNGPLPHTAADAPEATAPNFTRANCAICTHEDKRVLYSNKLRKDQRLRKNKERRSMEEAASHTTVQNRVQQMLDNTPQPTAAELSQAGGDTQKFQVGHTVQQWWASWFCTATTAPVQTNTKERGAWYSATINGCAGKRDIFYAGIQHHQVFVYHVY